MGSSDLHSTFVKKIAFIPELFYQRPEANVKFFSNIYYFSIYLKKCIGLRTLIMHKAKHTKNVYFRSCYR